MNRRRTLVIDACKVVATALLAGGFLRAESFGEAIGLSAAAGVIFAVAFFLTPDEDEPK